MPNYCENTLIVKGDLDQLADFKNKVLKVTPEKELQFTMETLFPTPTELLGETSPQMFRGDNDDEKAKEEWQNRVIKLKEKYGHTDWYDWRIANWGTKWDACSPYYVDEDNGESLTIGYYTAWSPNIYWLKKVSVMYPNLKFSLLYEESGYFYCGRYETIYGLELYNEQGEPINVDEEGREVYYDSELERYRYKSDDSVIDDEDFWPKLENIFK